MIPRCFAVVVVAGACGAVAPEPMDGGGNTITYRGNLDETPPQMFGGGMYCTYNITLKQLAIELGLLPSSKQVITGHVQALNVESVVVTTPPCPYGAADPTIANYTFTSATPTGSGMTLTFQGAATNRPVATLLINLSPAGAGYAATLTFHRTDELPPLDWSVNVTLPLAAQ